MIVFPYRQQNIQAKNDDDEAFPLRKKDVISNPEMFNGVRLSEKPIWRAGNPSSSDFRMNDFSHYCKRAWTPLAK